MTERETKLRQIVRGQIIGRLQRDLEGGEYVMKEAWEECYGDDEELEIIKDELRFVIRIVSSPKPRSQFDPGAHVYMREAIEALREQRDAHGNKHDKYDKLTIVARNLRDPYEWLYPLLWQDDPEFVPFERRSVGI